MKTRKIKINGLAHQFYFWGNPKKEKLFLIHGWLDTGASFDFLAHFLKDRFFCIAPDLRGYGQSEHTRNPLGYFFHEYAADLHAMFHHFSPGKKIKVLGHSLGGAITGFYAGAFPERLSHFINVEGFSFRNNPPEKGPEKLRNWILHLHAKRFNIFSDLDHFAKRLTQTNPRLPIDRARFLAQFLTKKVKGGFTMAADPKHKLSEPTVLLKPLVYTFWRHIEAKCLLVLADQTNMNDWVQAKSLKKEIAERLRQFPRGSQKEEIKNCGHMVHHERPEELAELVLRFLK